MEKYDSHYVQVLWVEDDPDVTLTYPLEAAKYGLQLVPFPCWDDAKAALEIDYHRWSAIILDAKCKQHRESADNAVRFLGEALKDIASLSKEKRRVIPWYVLTGGAETEVSDSITDDRMNWDADWTNVNKKNYYSKNVDNESLYTRIKDHANKSPRIQIQEMYRDTYNQLSQLNPEVCDDILTILETMHFPDSHPDFTPRYFFNPVRKALEYVFRSTQKVGIIPDDFFKGNIVNLNQCFMFLIGKEAEKLGYRHKDGGITPRHIQDIMSLIINLGNSNSHSTESSHLTELNEEEIEKYDNHIIALGGNSRLLIFSIALQLCEVTQWMNHYIKRHLDKEKNRQKWVKIEVKIEDRKEKGNDVLDSELIGALEEHEGIFHMGTKFSVLLKRKEWLGKTIKVLNYVANTNPKTNKYPYFIREQDFELLDEIENGSK